jgi:hypothetical protein
MRTLLGWGQACALAAGAVLASPPAAAAAGYLCRAEVHGPVSGMVLTQPVGADGKPRPGTMRWFAPHPASKAYPALMIDFEIPDSSKTALGKVTQVTATLATVMTTMPTAKSADLVLTFADHSEVRIPWQLYGVEHGPPPAAGQPLRLEVSGSLELITGRKADADADAQIAKGVAAGGPVRVWIVGDDKTIFADNTLELGATPERDVSLQDVFSQMRRKLVDPDLSCQAK